MVIRHKVIVAKDLLTLFRKEVLLQQISIK